MVEIIASQYRASLKMFLDTVDRCRDELWNDGTYKFPFWRVAYHALFFTDLYLARSADGFTPWDKHVDELESLGPMRHKGGRMPAEGPPYQKGDVTEFGRTIEAKIPSALESIDLTGESGFFWLELNKLELQFYNIRHLQFHTGELSERLRQRYGDGPDWVACAGGEA